MIHKDTVTQMNRNKLRNNGELNRGPTTTRKSGNYGKTGHNAQKFQVDHEIAIIIYFSGIMTSRGDV
ncbi:hypothetical protein HI914_01184 [Erysiphe necator]|nr:hypothetical protein HI914_01184 [Erysiphe necator]